MLVGVVDPVLSSRYYATDGRNDGGSNGPPREPIADVSDVSLGLRRRCRRWWQIGGGRDGNRSGGYGDDDGDDDGGDEDEGDRHRGDCGDEYGIVATILDNTVTSWSHAVVRIVAGWSRCRSVWSIWRHCDGTCPHRERARREQRQQQQQAERMNGNAMSTRARQLLAEVTLKKVLCD